MARERYQRIKAEGGIPSQLRNGEKVAKQYRRKRAAAVAIYGGCCEWCGTVNELEFDHIDGGGTKHREVESYFQLMQRIATGGVRIKSHRLRLLCRPCHRGPGWKQRRTARDGVQVLEDRRAS